MGGGRSYDQEAYIEARDLSAYVDRLVSLLPARQKEAFILSRKEGLSIKAISEKMNISTKGVERHIYLALKFIKSNLPLFICFVIDSFKSV